MKPTDELTDTVALAGVFKRQLDVSLMAGQAAKLIYQATAVWIGGGCLDWNDLTPQVKAEKRQAVIALIVGPDVSPLSLPQQADGHRDDLNFDGHSQDEQEQP